MLLARSQSCSTAPPSGKLNHVARRRWDIKTSSVSLFFELLQPHWVAADIFASPNSVILSWLFYSKALTNIWTNSSLEGFSFNIHWTWYEGGCARVAALQPTSKFHFGCPVGSRHLQRAAKATLELKASPAAAGGWVTMMEGGGGGRGQLRTKSLIHRPRDLDGI